MALTDNQLYKLVDNVNSYYRLVSESKRELLLNKYPNAAAAYSLRLLDGYYRGPLVRVRRDDGNEVDVYPDYNNELSLDSLVSIVDTGANTTENPLEPPLNPDPTFTLSLHSLGEFVHDPAYDSSEPVSAYVCVWYDQSKGNDFESANNAKQTAASNQPLIYNDVNGVILNVDGKVACDFNTVGSSLGVSNSFFIGNDDVDMFVVIETNDTSGIMFGCAGSEYIGYITSGTDRPDSEFGLPIYYINGVDNNITTRAEFRTYVSTGAPVLLSISDGNTQLWGDFQNNLGIGSYFENSGLSVNGKYSEIIIYTSDQSSNRGGIEQDINDHYQIEGYTPPQPLLDEFDGAAAAYSLRKLSGSYTGPLVRVRRDSATGGDDVEVDVYPDENGGFSLLSPIEDVEEISNSGATQEDANKNTLYEFVYGQSCDLMVVVWYDQSGNGLDAEQTTTGNQPKIYDSSTGVITDGGLPSVNFKNADRFVLNSQTTISDYCFFFVDSQITDLRVFGLVNGTEYIRRQSSRYIIYDGSTFYIDNVTFSNERSVHSVVNNVGAFQNGSKLADYNRNVTIAVDSVLYSNGTVNIAELIIYPTAVDATERTGIETNINDYYNIY